MEEENAFKRILKDFDPFEYGDVYSYGLSSVIIDKKDCFLVFTNSFDKILYLSSLAKEKGFYFKKLDKKGEWFSYEIEKFDLINISEEERLSLLKFNLSFFEKEIRISECFSLFEEEVPLRFKKAIHEAFLIVFNLFSSKSIDIHSKQFMSYKNEIICIDPFI